MSRCGEPFRSASTASRRTVSFGSRVASSCSIDLAAFVGAGRVARELLEREQRRAAAGRALVVEPAPQQLLLLAEAELRERAVGERAHAVVGVPGGGLDLVRPLLAQVREPALVARLGELVRARGGLGEGQAGCSERGAGPT